LIWTPVVSCPHVAMPVAVQRVRRIVWNVAVVWNAIIVG
jgi:hypothetical protein